MIEQARSWLVALAVASLTMAGAEGPAQAQVPIPPRPGSPQPQFRDPTQPSPEVRQAIEATQALPNPASPSAAPVAPQIKLKAKLIGSIGQPVAVLDVNGQQFIVHVESEIEAPVGSGSKIVVRELNLDEVRLEMLPLKRMVVLR